MASALAPPLPSVWLLAEDLASLCKHRCLRFQGSSEAQNSGQGLARGGRPISACRHCPLCTSAPALEATSASRALPGCSLQVPWQQMLSAVICDFPACPLFQCHCELLEKEDLAWLIPASPEPGRAWARSRQHPASSSSGGWRDDPSFASDSSEVTCPLNCSLGTPWRSSG